MYKNILNEIKLPDDLKRLSIDECKVLCHEIRRLLIKTVEKNGGHLASNLGTVELTVALHRAFDSPHDKIVWDVGHQAYTHKILTGRLDRLDTIRKKNGLSGFTRPNESEHDAFISGHSSISVSAACGIGRAMQIKGDNTHHVIAVVGDGAITGGEIYEGLNNAGKGLNNLIVVLNDNEMSISKNVGAVSKYLTSIRGNEKYISVKKQVEKALNAMPEIISVPVKDILNHSKDTLRWILYHDTMFENLGFVYLGPVDGHDIKALDEVFKAAKIVGKPVLIHVRTKKGKGYLPAEKNPGAFHGLSPHEVRIPEPMVNENSFSAVFGHEIERLAGEDKRICAVTAAMKYAVGLNFFAAKFPERFFDVGIAEEHAVTFCGGLASQGLIPVFAVYSSFLQRSYDQLIHDNAIMSNHIVLCIDRAGIVGEDGETHQGLFDVAMLTSIPNVTVFSPSDYTELKICLKKVIYEYDGICAVRYPKGSETKRQDNDKDHHDFIYSGKNHDTLFVSYGRISENLPDSVDKLKLVKIFPIDEEIVSICKNYNKVIFFEEGIKYGGIAEHLAAKISENNIRTEFTIKAVEEFVSQGSVCEVLSEMGFDKRGMEETNAS